jgi:hypothetical protein
MAFKHALHQLQSIDAFDDEVTARLQVVDITTAEEFVGAYTADPAAVCDVIDLDVAATERLRDEALAVVDEDTREKLVVPADSFALGASPPSET